MNDKIFNWDKIHKMFPEPSKRGNAKPHTKENISKMLEMIRVIDKKALLLVLASSGCRIIHKSTIIKKDKFYCNLKQKTLSQIRIKIMNQIVPNQFSIIKQFVVQLGSSQIAVPNTQIGGVSLIHVKSYTGFPFLVVNVFGV